MQLWMSILCGLIHLTHRGSSMELLTFIVAQTVFLITGALEAGRDESGFTSRILIPVRFLSIIGLLTYAAFSLRTS